MTVKKLIALLQRDDHHREISPDAEVCLAEDKMVEWKILSVYPSDDGKTLWIDIEPDKMLYSL